VGRGAGPGRAQQSVQSLLKNVYGTAVFRLPGLAAVVQSRAGLKTDGTDGCEACIQSTDQTRPDGAEGSGRLCRPSRYLSKRRRISRGYSTHPMVISVFTWKKIWPLHFQSRRSNEQVDAGRMAHVCSRSSAFALVQVYGSTFLAAPRGEDRGRKRGHTDKAPDETTSRVDGSCSHPKRSLR